MLQDRFDSWVALRQCREIFFIARFTVDLVSQGTSLANFTICINKMKTKSFEIKRDEVVDIPYKSTFV